MHNTERTHTFDVGEEVVVRLNGTRVFQVEDRALQLWAMPPWAIAEILTASDGGSGATYRIRFQYGDDFYRCDVPESAIEGRA